LIRPPRINFCQENQVWFRFRNQLDQRVGPMIVLQHVHRQHPHFGSRLLGPDHFRSRQPRIRINLHALCWDENQQAKTGDLQTREVKDAHPPFVRPKDRQHRGSTDEPSRNPEDPYSRFLAPRCHSQYPCSP
jgi:hypothetical protein